MMGADYVGRERELEKIIEIERENCKDARVRIAKALRHASANCAGCKECDKSCLGWAFKRILRGEPTEECKSCGEHVDTLSTRDYCLGCEAAL